MCARASASAAGPAAASCRSRCWSTRSSARNVFPRKRTQIGSLGSDATHAKTSMGAGRDHRIILTCVYSTPGGSRSRTASAPRGGPSEVVAARMPVLIAVLIILPPGAGRRHRQEPDYREGGTNTQGVRSRDFLLEEPSKPRKTHQGRRGARGTRRLGSARACKATYVSHTASRFRWLREPATTEIELPDLRG